jgi:integrase
MSEKRVTVWVQRFKDRKHLMLQWLDPDTGQRKSRSAKTDAEDKAEQARADLEYELNHGKYQEASRLSWERFRELFEEEYVAGRRPSTRLNYRATLDLFEELCHPASLRRITERTVSAFAAGMRKRPTRGREGMQASTIKVYLMFLHRALSWAVEQKMLPSVPKFPAVKVPKKRPQPVPPEAFERLFDRAPDQQTRVYLLTCWLSGLRRTEAFELEWEATAEAPYIDLGRNRIILPAELVKADEDQWVPLDPALREALLALPRHGKKVFRFLDPRDGHPICPSTLGDRIIRLARKAGVKLGAHALRRGFGCRYAGKVSAHVLQRLMRHANIATTMNYYANIDAAVEEAVLGPQCNTSRNTVACPPESATSGEDASPSSNVA